MDWNLHDTGYLQTTILCLCQNSSGSRKDKEFAGSLTHGLWETDGSRYMPGWLSCKQTWIREGPEQNQCPVNTWQSHSTMWSARTLNVSVSFLLPQGTCCSTALWFPKGLSRLNERFFLNRLNTFKIYFWNQKLFSEMQTIRKNKIIFCTNKF